ncbi:MAG: hypothetical protein NW226_06430 [Microscillaceae bacterium]|nr:hypothetical protein [Microscillaceae bacterium]
MKKIILYVLGLSFGAGCSPKIISIGQEDLAQYRNQYTYQKEQYTGSDANRIVDIPLEYDSTTQEYHITFELNKNLDYVYTPVAVRPQHVNVDGYRIQIYRGRSQVEASRARQRCYELFSTKLTPYMKYQAPTYRVSVGDFLEPYEYQPFLKILKKEFPTAIVVPDIVTIIVQSRPDQKRDGLTSPPPVQDNEENKD